MKLSINSSCFSLLLTICVLTSCRTLNESDIHSRYSISPKLPALIAEYDDNSFYTVYGISKSIEISNGTTITQNNDIDSLAENKNRSITHYSRTKTNVAPSPIKEKRIKLIQDLFDYEINNNICNKLGETIGSAECKMISARTYDSGELLKYISFLGGFYAINLVGFPHHTCTATMEIQVDIKNTSGIRVATYYSGFQKATTFVALLWGYDSTQGLEKARYSVFHKCIDNIKQQIEADSERIIELLEFNN